jgi:ribosome maturation protein Sdo1
MENSKIHTYNTYSEILRVNELIKQVDAIIPITFSKKQVSVHRLW